MLQNPKFGKVRLVRGFFTCILMVASFQAAILFAQDLSPVGRWKTVSDKTGEVTSIVNITLEKGELVGRIEELFRKPGQNPNPICNECSGEQKNMPIIGLTILSGLTQDGDEWNGGYILDPDDGTSYRCIIKVTENGEELHVRGYIGFSLFGRTQVWLKEG